MGMPGKIFINYRRDDERAVATRVRYLRPSSASVGRACTPRWARRGRDAAVGDKVLSCFSPSTTFGYGFRRTDPERALVSLIF